jgi:hypothetical protein
MKSGDSENLREGVDDPPFVVDDKNSRRLRCCSGESDASGIGWSFPRGISSAA